MQPENLFNVIAHTAEQFAALNEKLDQSIEEFVQSNIGNSDQRAVFVVIGAYSIADLISTASCVIQKHIERVNRAFDFPAETPEQKIKVRKP